MIGEVFLLGDKSRCWVAERAAKRVTRIPRAARRGQNARHSPSRSPRCRGDAAPGARSRGRDQTNSKSIAIATVAPAADGSFGSPLRLELGWLAGRSLSERAQGPPTPRFATTPADSLRQNRERRLVSRVGIEPTTRRLRVQGAASTDVQPCPLCSDSQQFASGRIHCFHLCSGVRVSHPARFVSGDGSGASRSGRGTDRVG